MARLYSAALLLSLLAPSTSSVVAQAPPAATTPEARGVAFLLDELPRWRAEHGCASCLNNGDAARALFVARARGHQVGTALDGTLAFLEKPADWNRNGSQANEMDQALVRVQFAAALAAAGLRDAKPGQALIAAAALLDADQQRDGSFVVVAADAPSSPVTWSNPIATALARSTFIASGREPDHFSVAQIDRWSRTVAVEQPLDAAGVLLALGGTADVMADKQRAQCLSLLRRAQAENGGWTGTTGGTPQVFDTAVALLALAQYSSDPRLARSTYRPEELKDAVARGRAYLAAQQKPDGSWPEPAGTPNKAAYAARISTSAWALIALVETSE